MSRLLLAVLTVALASPGIMFAQAAQQPASPTVPASQAVKVQGCVEPMQRDGSLAPKAGATARPDNAITEANKGDQPLDIYLLLDAVPSNAAADKAGAGETVRSRQYVLNGHASELGALRGHRVEVVGSLLPKADPSRLGKSASAADGTEHLRISSIKPVAGSCSAKKP